MVNKQGLWFLTLTSLALVLSVYYITMPNELLLSNNSNYVDKTDSVNKEEGDTDIKTSNLITSMRVDLDEERNLLINELEGKLSDSKLSVDEKNEVYEDLKYISELSSRESMLEKKIKDDTISVVINSSNHDKSLVVNIMKSLQEEFSDKMYISISFKE